jgi:hypothetical protein
MFLGMATKSCPLVRKIDGVEKMGGYIHEAQLLCWARAVTTQLSETVVTGRTFIRCGATAGMSTSGAAGSL